MTVDQMPLDVMTAEKCHSATLKTTVDTPQFLKLTQNLILVHSRNGSCLLQIVFFQQNVKILLSNIIYKSGCGFFVFLQYLFKVGVGFFVRKY